LSSTANASAGCPLPARPLSASAPRPSAASPFARIDAGRADERQPTGRARSSLQAPKLRAEIERLRARHAPAAPRVPDAERAREASLRQRNAVLLAENRRLREQVAELTAELAIAYGHRRAAH
jgi:hypothetical protein